MIRGGYVLMVLWRRHLVLYMLQRMVSLQKEALMLQCVILE